jgi:ATP-dependent helicase/nuclease subunit B
VISRLIEAVDSGRTVLVPNTELAAALVDAVERAHRDQGRLIWATPRIRDFGGWLKDRHVRRQLVDSTVPRCLTDVEERELWRHAVLESDSDRRFLEPSGAARAARRARRATHEYGIPIGAVAADGGEESAMFVEWSARFAERCRDLGCVGADELLGTADADSTHDGERDAGVAWIESPLWRPVARRWLERHAGIPLTPTRAPHGSQAASPQILRAQAPAAELAAIAQWARANLALRPDFRAWVCVPDLAQRRPDVVDAFDAALVPHRFALQEAGAGAPYAVAGGTPLADYAPVRSALELLSAANGRIPFARFSALLRAPELSESSSEASAAACLDIALRSRAPAEHFLTEWLTLAEKVERLEELRPAAALGRLTGALRPLVEMTGSHPMSRWLSVWIAAFQTGPWSLRHRWSSHEYQSAERFRELLATLALGDASFGGQSRSSAESVLRRAARDTQFQVQTGIPPIWVSGQWMDPWLGYDGLWVASCDETHWPPPVEPIPLLPVRLQRQYGVVAAAMESQLRFADDLQRRWLERATVCVFSCADAEDGRRAAPSPLVASSDEAKAPSAARSATAATAFPGAVPAGAVPVASHPHWLTQLEHAPATERLEDEWAPPFGGGERTRGVSTLKAQSRCAFRGFAETRLRAERLEYPVPGFNERERGELVHDSLEHIWSELRGSAGLAAILARPEELEHLTAVSARRALARLCARRDPGELWRDRERVRLERLLARWLELEGQRDSFEVERLEEGSEIARHAGLDFSVRIDRIDRLSDGARLLIDYKTGAANRDWQGERPDNPQLPIYALLHRKSLIAVAYGKINAADCTFVAESERSGVFPRKRATRMEGIESFAALLDRWSERIERLAIEFHEGRAAVDPIPTACRSCHLHGLCRVPSTMDLSESLDEPPEEA